MKRWQIAAAAIVVVFTAVAAVPFVIGDTETLALDDTARAAMQGKTFLALPEGVTHYTWHGPASGNIVVLVHGFSTPSWVWEKQVPALVEAGHRVLTYDLYGRGLSDRPHVDYNADLYDRQLVALLDTLEVKTPVDIVGLSMGGAITIRFCDRHPERVKRFALIAPAGMGASLPAATRLLAVPGLGPWAMKAFGDRILMGQIKEFLLTRPDLAPVIAKRYQEQMQYKGYKNALRSTLLHMSLGGMEEEYKRVGQRGLPSALFWGTRDQIVPYALHEKVRASLPGGKFHSIEGAGHGVNLEEPEKINPALVAFLTAAP